MPDRRMEKLDSIVIGAGVVGLAIARSLALSGREVVVLEAMPAAGTETTSRNSEVIHAGIYYPNDSLKARLCVRGKQMLYEYCEQKGVPFRRVGKMIVASNEAEIQILENYRQQATLNGVTDLEFLAAADIANREPNVRCVGAVLSPSTGIVDSHELVTALCGDIESSAGSIVFRSPVTEVSIGDGNLCVTVDNETQVQCTTLVNAAGLGANDIAMRIHGFPTESVPPLHLSIGHYYSYSGRSPFNGLVYPIASGGGLGIHATIDMAGATRFGPDIRPIDSVDYEFDDSRKADFVDAIGRYFPDVDTDRLLPAYTGIRPKLSRPGGPFADFCIQGERDHRIHGLVNVFGIESPGLTASLALGDFVAMLLKNH